VLFRPFISLLHTSVLCVEILGLAYISTADPSEPVLTYVEPTSRAPHFFFTFADRINYMIDWHDTTTCPDNSGFKDYILTPLLFIALFLPTIHVIHHGSC
jgi:hypothetical protein